MGFGAELAMRALDGIYTPSVNPDAYGADASGNIVDKTGKVVPLYSQPSWFQKLVSPTAQQYAVLNADEASMPTKAKQQNALELSRNTNLVGKLPTNNNPFYTEDDNENADPFATDEANSRLNNATNAWAASLTNGGLSPSNSKQQIGSESGINTGLIGDTGGTTEKLSNVLTHSGLSQAQFEGGQLPTTQAATAASNADLLNRVTNLNPVLTSADIIRGNAALHRANTEENTKDLMARYGNNAALFGIHDQGLNQSTEHRNSLAANYNAGLIGQRGTNIPFAASVDDNGGVSEIQGLNSSYANMMRLANAKMGQGGDSMAVDPNHGYTMPAKPMPIKAGNYLPGSVTHPAIKQAQDYKPIEGLEGYYLNDKEGKIKDSSGNDVTQQLANNPVTKQIIANELNKREKELEDEHQSKIDEVKDHATRVHAANVSKLKAQMADLEANKLSTGLISAYSQQGAPDSYYKNPLFGMPIALGQEQAALERAQLPAHFMNGLHKLSGLGTKGYQSLFGQ